MGGIDVCFNMSLVESTTDRPQGAIRPEPTHYLGKTNRALKNESPPFIPHLGRRERLGGDGVHQAHLHGRRARLFFVVLCVHTHRGGKPSVDQSVRTRKEGVELAGLGWAGLGSRAGSGPP